MDKMLPYQALMETKGITFEELPKAVQKQIRSLESTLRGVSNFGKTDENGDYIITESVKQKIDTKDKEIVNSMWDYLEEKQKEEIRQNLEPKPTPTPKPVEEPKEPTPSPAPLEDPKPIDPPKPSEDPKPDPKPEPKKESTGRIGFFEF